MVGVAAITLAGCSQSTVESGSQDPVETARTLNIVFKETVAEVQLQVWDGDWVVVRGNYGEFPETCAAQDAGDDAYQFEMERRTPASASFTESTDQLADRMTSWLRGAGWDNVERAGDGASQTVSASADDSDIASLVVRFGADAVSVGATSTCRHAGYAEVSEHLQDTAGSDATPEMEPPGAPIRFGDSDADG